MVAKSSDTYKILQHCNAFLDSATAECKRNPAVVVGVASAFFDGNPIRNIQSARSEGYETDATNGRLAGRERDYSLGWHLLKHGFQSVGSAVSTRIKDF
jgi:hypothetical protein